MQVFHVRGGRVRGQRGWVVDIDEIPGDSEQVQARLTGQFLAQFYGEEVDVAERTAGEGSPVPKQVLVPALPEDVDAITEWLSSLRGSKVHIRVPQRGDKRALAETVERNAKEALTQHKMRRAGDLTARSAALNELQEALGLDTAPLRIECVDVSHIQGADVVASLVVFEDALPRKSEYRRFAIRDAADKGDVAAIAEVVRRRFARYKSETQQAEGERPGIDPETGRPKKFAYPPNLLVVDGAGPQATAAAEVLSDMGITDVAVIGLAKRLEEVWQPAEPYPVILPRSSESLYLLQRVRDEAHRFAITYHRDKRARRVRASELDKVPGLGQARKQALIKHFGSVKRLKEASVEDIAQVKGFGKTTAAKIYAALHEEQGTT